MGINQRAFDRLATQMLFALYIFTLARELCRDDFVFEVAPDATHKVQHECNVERVQCKRRDGFGHRMPDATHQRPRVVAD